ncbi:17945_t:CDS:2 [Acaulospora morrowiae]|uniref:17945_t:CDS:1 n=1 Tax=Acaulospora morrowiae TaxID=94023 RepID=A0A9N9AGP6_9GLOM|nr:17945_t:CDS:2 [Acaulospora morrowiae]
MHVNYPPPRGYDNGLVGAYPCGGLSSINASTITTFPLTKGNVSLRFGDGDGTLTLYFANNSNGTFIQVSDNETLSVPAGGQNVTVKPDLSKANATVGTLGVLQAVFARANNNGSWYACSDISVISDDSLDKKSGGIPFAVPQSVEPPARGTVEVQEPNPPCGGFNAVNSAKITNFPVSHGQATANFEDGDGTLIYYFSSSSNVTNATSFIQVSDPQSLTIPNSGKQVTTLIDLSRAKAVIGTSGVLQSVFNTSTETWYQCADIKISGAINMSPCTDGILLLIGLVSVLTYFI